MTPHNNSAKIKNFFSDKAINWDKTHKVNDFTTAMNISLIYKNSKNKKVLDVGCGTGIMLPFLLARFGDVYACDISSKMTKIASKKYPLAKVHTIDFEKNSYYRASYFDVIIIYNAFPHFISKTKVLSNANKILKDGGTLIIAHSLGRRELNLLHMRVGGAVVSHILPDNGSLKDILKKCGFVKIKIVEKNNFILTAIKNKSLQKKALNSKAL